jgi:hypothetical protein
MSLIEVIRHYRQLRRQYKQFKKYLREVHYYSCTVRRDNLERSLYGHTFHSNDQGRCKKPWHEHHEWSPRDCREGPEWLACFRLGRPEQTSKWAQQAHLIRLGKEHAWMEDI